MDTYRLKRVGYGAAILMGCGAAYTVFVKIAGFGFPCIFREITGLFCPGCGVTHMCLCLVRMDFSGAFSAHPVLLALLPIWIIVLIKNAVLYVRTGSWRLTNVENGILYFSIVALLAFGVIRNITALAL